MAEKEKKKMDYGEISPILLANLDKFESLYHAHLVRKGDYGKDGLKDALQTSIWGLRNKIGLEGILSGLESQAEQNIGGGDGLNARFELSAIIEQGAKDFSGSLAALKINDILPYINGRLTDIAIEEKYPESTLAQLMRKEASKDKKLYAAYIDEQVRNAVMARGSQIAYQERARKLSEAYSSGQLQIKESKD